MILIENISGSVCGQIASPATFSNPNSTQPVPASHTNLSRANFARAPSGPRLQNWWKKSTHTATSAQSQGKLQALHPQKFTAKNFLGEPPLPSSTHPVPFTGMRYAPQHDMEKVPTYVQLYLYTWNSPMPKASLPRNFPGKKRASPACPSPLAPRQALPPVVAFRHLPPA